MAALETLVETATGPAGLLFIFVYSVLVAFALPLPGELVLLPAPRMELGVGPAASVAVVVVVSAAGKALGSVAAFRLGRGVVSTGPLRWLGGLFVPDYGPSPRGGRLAAFVRKYEYLGLAALLAVPLLPDTVVVYAFSAVAGDERRFVVAAFFGTVCRLLVALALLTGALLVV